MVQKNIEYTEYTFAAVIKYFSQKWGEKSYKTDAADLGLFSTACL